MLAIFGPTAVGKSALTHQVAGALGGEIIVADPFQRYRGLEVAADAPCAADRAEVPYHLVGDLDLAQESSAGSHSARAHEVIDALAETGRVPLVAGGTGLYLRACLTQLHMRPAPPAEVRAWAEALVGDLPAAVARLREMDGQAADAIDTSNPRRVARALERAATGQRGDGGGDIWRAPVRRPTLLVGVTRPREVIHDLIATRVRRELDDGLREELEVALARPDLARAPTQVIGMREVQAVRDGLMDAGELAQALIIRTRRLARMQDTWMRRMAPDVVIDLGAAPPGEAVDAVVAEWRRARGGVG